MLNLKFLNVDKNTKSKFYRIILTSTIFTIISLNSIFSSQIMGEDNMCIIDSSHLFFEIFHNFFKAHITFKCFCLIIIGIVLDLSALYLTFQWINYGRTWKPIAIIIQFLSIKFICGLLFQTKYTDDTLWEYSGFPSLLVSYKNTNDLFFSSLIGLNLIFAVEIENIALNLKKENKKYFEVSLFSIVCYINIIFKLIVDLSIRSHYIIDEFTGLTFAHYCIISSDELSNFLNNLIPLEHNENSNEQSEIFLSEEMTIKEKWNNDYLSRDRDEIEVVNEKYFI